MVGTFLFRTVECGAGRKRTRISGFLFETFTDPSGQYGSEDTCHCSGKTYDDIFLPTISKPVSVQYKV